MKRKLKVKKYKKKQRGRQQPRGVVAAGGGGGGGGAASVGVNIFPGAYPFYPAGKRPGGGGYPPSGPSGGGDKPSGGGNKPSGGGSGGGDDQPVKKEKKIKTEDVIRDVGVALGSAAGAGGAYAYRRPITSAIRTIGKGLTKAAQGSYTTVTNAARNAASAASGLVQYLGERKVSKDPPLLSDNPLEDFNIEKPGVTQGNIYDDMPPLESF